jgi:hypothetical protein
MLKDLLATEPRAHIERWCRDRVRTAAMPDDFTLVRVLGEHPMVVDLRDTSIAPHLTLDGYWETGKAVDADVQTLSGAAPLGAPCP